MSGIAREIDDLEQLVWNGMRRLKLLYMCGVVESLQKLGIGEEEIYLLDGKKLSAHGLQPDIYGLSYRSCAMDVPEEEMIARSHFDGVAFNGRWYNVTAYWMEDMGLNPRFLQYTDEMMKKLYEYLWRELKIPKSRRVVKKHA